MSEPQRKIIHVDMDAFYASVEQRDDALLRGKPVVVAWLGDRSVVCAASYEARKFGVRSAMPARRAERLCPEAIFVPPDFGKYRAVSQQIRDIFAQHTSLIEPLSLDEAYLDVSAPLSDLPSATAIAESIRADILSTTQLTASAGVAPNKFLAKIASDWRKPNGQFVIKPHQVERFLAPLPVGRLPGVGPNTRKRLALLGIRQVAQLRTTSQATLERELGSMGTRLHELAQGIDHNPVSASRQHRSVSSEDTLADDLPLAELAPHVARMAAKTWTAAAKSSLRGRTVVLKLKTADFQILSRSHTRAEPFASPREIETTAVELLERVDMEAGVLFRLVGVGLSHFEQDRNPSQASLFE